MTNGPPGSRFFLTHQDEAFEITETQHAEIIRKLRHRVRLDEHDKRTDGEENTGFALVRETTEEECSYRNAIPLRREEFIEFQPDATRPENWIARQSPDIQELLRVVYEMVKEVDPTLEEALFASQLCLKKGRDAVLGLMVTVNQPALGFFGGSSLQDPHGLLEGSAGKLRIIKLTKFDPLPLQSIRSLVEQAVAGPTAEAAGPDTD